MFKVGDYVVHGRNGVCEIADIAHIDIDGVDKNRLYYILVPIHSSGSRIYYPVDSDRVVMRAILTKEELEQIIAGVRDIEPIWIENERQREIIYKEAINSCDCRQLISVIKALYERNQERMAQGKRITFVDDRYMKEAKKNLYDEFSVVLNISQDDVEEYISSHIK